MNKKIEIGFICAKHPSVAHIEIFGYGDIDGACEQSAIAKVFIEIKDWVDKESFYTQEEVDESIIHALEHLTIPDKEGSNFRELYEWRKELDKMTFKGRVKWFIKNKLEKYF